MEEMMTTQEVARYFKVEPKTITQKFIKEGLKVFPVGKRDYRYNKKDVEEFEEYKKQLEQERYIQIIPIKKKTKSKKINIDFQKRKINLEQMRVV